MARKELKMPDYDQKERALGGTTVEAKDEAELAKVRANLVSLTRVNKGLPQEPIGLDMKALSGLSNSVVIDEPAEAVEPKVVPIDISRLPSNRSVVGLATVHGRLDKISKGKAA